MNYKFLPLFAVILMMAVAPTPAVFGQLSSPVTIEANPSDNTVELGNLDPFQTPHGMVANADGNFVAYKLSDGVENFLFFSKTTDGGSTYTTPLNVTGVQTTGFGYGINQVTVFANATSDTIDILYTEETGGGGGENIMHIRSTDNGNTFGSPTVAVSSVALMNDNIWYAVNGDDVFILYAPANSSVEFAGSYDGGSTFPTQTTIYDTISQSGTLPNGGFNNVVMQTGGGGTGSSSYVWIAFTATDGTNLDTDIYASYSTDGGGNWSALENVSDGGTVNEGLNFQTHLFVDYVNNDTIIIFQGEGGGGTNYLSYAKSTNFGVSYNAQVNVELGVVCDWQSAQSSSHVVSYDGTNIQAICFGDGGTDLMQSRSTDFGDTWASWQSIASNTSNTHDFGKVIIKAIGSLVIAFGQFIDVPSGEVPYYEWSTSSDGGVTFDTPEQVSAINQTNTSRTQVQGFGSTAYLVTEELSGINTILGWFESFDSDIPVITLVGSTPVTVPQFGTYTELGATCIDPTEGDISGNVVVGGDTVDENTVNTYIVDYDCDDSASNSAVTVQRTVNVVADSDNPTITLLGSNPQTMRVDTSYSENGATCIDPTEGDITGNVVINTAGLTTTVVSSENTVLYDCQDSAGNDATQVSRQVVVQKASQGISSGTTSGGVQGLGGTTTVQTLDDVPEPTTEDIQAPQPAPLLSFNEQGQPTGTTSGQSIADIFRNLFANQLNAQTGEIEDGQSRTVADDIQSFLSGEPSPETIAGEQRTERQEAIGVNIVNTISNFFSNFFN